MVGTLVIAALSVAGLIALVLVKPHVKIKGAEISVYWVAPLLGALLLLVCGFLDWGELWRGLTADNAVNPLKILTLFVSMTVLSIFLDEAGFFEYLADRTLKRAGNNQRILFVYLYVTVSILTVFTSNDIVILTFTSFICDFCRKARINPVPYLVAEFAAANTWSMALVIGNPTNIYLATASGIDFVSYLTVMILPTVLGGLVEFGMLWLLFGKLLKAPLEHEIEDVKIADRGLLAIGLTYLIACTVLLAVSSYIGLEMWYICLAFAGAMFISVTVYKLCKKEKPVELLNCLKRAPWELIPFVLSMFVLVLALDKFGVTGYLAKGLGDEYAILTYGTSSYAVANLINNIPMSVLYGSVTTNLTGEALRQAVYASVVGSNIGAFLTPIGALAGIMWMNIIKRHNMDLPFAHFVKYGILISVPTLFATLGGLYLAFLYA